MSAVAISNAARWVIPFSVALWQNWDQIARQFDRAVTSGVPEFLGYYCQNVFEMRESTAGAWTERGSFGVHYLNTTGGDPDYTWTSGDFSAIESGAQALWTANLAQIPNTFRLVEHRWYAFGAGVVKPNPVYRTTVLGTPIVGTSTSGTVRQAAFAVTLKTPLRPHWGRFYLPMTAARADSAGRIASGNVDTFVDAARTFVNSGSSAGVYPCVYDRARKTAIGVNSIQGDDIPDIIRRRRPDVTFYRKSYVLP